MKTCSKCGEQFRPTASQVRLHVGQCRPCMTAQNRAYRARDKALGKKYYTPKKYSAEQKTLWNRKSGVLPHNRRKHAARVKRYQENNPEKYRAHQALYLAVRRGEIVRQPCEVCGNVQSQGHHEDYAKPLEVRWVCAQHHKDLHREI